MIPASFPSVQRPALPAPVPNAHEPGYLEAVYAGVLGKLIGVYLGRPVENWSYARIAAGIGDVDYYVHDKRGRMLIVTDDDISGTFTFLRALEDYGFDPDLTSQQIGQTWLNYLIENTTILWWGGLGNSTEHTAYLRLKNGVQAPESGSAKVNSLQVAEQIGAQIFIDGWGLVCPGDPARAASYAERAARVSHDGEAVYGAQVIAALVSAAFIEKDIHRLLDIAVSQIPSNSVIAKLIKDLREWHRTGEDWRASREKLEANYGYDRFAGQCPIVPNHGVIILALLHGEGDFDRSLMIANTTGWDTDCNSGNVGAILGVRNGLAGLATKDWRGPVADRLYIPSADGGRSISDAAREAVIVTNAGRALVSLEPLAPKGGARFHFSLSGSVQGWTTADPAMGQASNVDGRLEIVHSGGNGRVVVSTPTFVPPVAKDMVTGYVLVANPTLFSGHTVLANLVPSGVNSLARMFIDRYNEFDETTREYSPLFEVRDQAREIPWRIPDTGGYPIHAVGIEVESGTLLLDSFTWQGVPTTSWP
ncbi:MAG: ADP-ribosylglycohydrolase family protein, partial [Armatimonadota bacterium]